MEAYDEDKHDLGLFIKEDNKDVPKFGSFRDEMEIEPFIQEPTTSGQISGEPIDQKPTACFVGEFKPSMHGKKKVLVFRFGEEAYAFQYRHYNQTKRMDKYACIQCRNRSKARRETKQTPIDVIGNIAYTDPRDGHICQPRKFVDMYIQRVTAKVHQRIRKSKKAETAIENFSEIRKLAQEDLSLTKDEKAHVEYILQFERKSNALNKAISAQNAVSSLAALEEKHKSTFFTGPDGKHFKFVQEHKPDRIICYSEELFRVAAQSGLVYLISDGMYDYFPVELDLKPRKTETKRGKVFIRNTTQMFTIHGVTRSGYHLPLMHAFLPGRDRKTYVHLFYVVRNHLLSAGCQIKNLKLVVDFEKGAISAINEVFSDAKLEGCFYHYEMCVNRASWRAGIQQDSPQLHEWHEDLLALPFVPEVLTHKTGALECPVAEDHPSFKGCQELLQYFKATWIEGPFQNLWIKFMTEDNGTSRIVENFHAAMDRQFAERPRPSLSEMMEFLHSNLMKRYYEVRETTFPESREMVKPLSPEYSAKKNEMNIIMTRFFNLFTESKHTTQDLKNYMRKMKQFIIRKSF